MKIEFTDKFYSVKNSKNYVNPSFNLSAFYAVPIDKKK